MKALIYCVLIFTAFAHAGTRKPLPKPSPKPTPPFHVELGNGLERFENKEVICYALSTGGLSCYWKPLDQVDEESEDSDYANK